MFAEVSFPIVSCDDPTLTCIVCNHNKCEWAILVRGPGRRVLSGIHADCAKQGTTTGMLHDALSRVCVAKVVGDVATDSDMIVLVVSDSTFKRAKDALAAVHSTREVLDGLAREPIDTEDPDA